MKYLKQILLASLVFSVVVLSAGTSAAEVGIPFGLKWGDSPETVEKACKKLFGEYTKNETTKVETLKIESEFTLEKYKFRVTFFFDTKGRLDSIHVSSRQKFENQLSHNSFAYIVERYFIDPFDSLPEYRKVRYTSYETVYFTPNSRISVVFGKINKDIEPEGKSFILMVTWDTNKPERFFIE